jgi:hypothetical protein
MRTHKFLAKGAQGPLSGFAWPVPDGTAAGAWVVADGPLAPCARGVHVCRPADLAHWVHDELWELEAEGDQIEGLDCIVVRRARLVRRIDDWGAAGGRRFAEACVEHAAAAAPASDLLGDARFMSAHGYVAMAAFTAAVAVGRSSSEEGVEAAYRRERAWQSAWIAEHLLGRL